jgi:DNA-binding transcriptional ArsR family regulator
MNIELNSLPLGADIAGMAAALDISRQQAMLLLHLLKHRVATPSELEALVGSYWTPLCRLRKALIVHDVTVHTQRKVGYHLTPEGKARVVGLYRAAMREG